MSKSHIILLVTLLVSFAVNAWQYTQHSKGHQELDSNALDAKQIASENALKRTPTQTKAYAESASSTKATAHMDLASIMAIRDPMERMLAMIEHIKNLPVDQIGEMLDELGNDKDPKTRFLSHLLLTRWGQEDPDAAFASLGNLSAKRNGSQANAILAGLATTDPNGAVAWLTNPDNNVQHQPWMGYSLASTLSAEWSRQDPDAALAWAATLEPGDLQTGAYSGIINHLLESDPERAASIAMDVESEDRPKLLGQIAETWAEQTPEAAVDWASTLEGRDRRVAMSEAMAGWAQAAPESAANYVNSLPAEERANHVGAVARSWAEQAPAEAALWLGAQPEGEGKADAMGHVMWNWTSQSPEAASAWLAEQPQGESFDRGVTGLAKAATHAFDDPEAGVTWSSTIQNEELRANMTGHTLGQWMQQDPAAARAWATANGVEVAPPSGDSGK
ncbi:MAG: hypothetical protein ACI8T1_004920 [Verrucomicrobiales bacterium]|jgi:hypothetical protein